MGGNWLITKVDFSPWLALIQSRKLLSSSACNICLPLAFPIAGNIGPSAIICNIMCPGFVYAPRTPRQKLNPLSKPPAKHYK